MTSSRLENPTDTPGAHRARRRAPRDGRAASRRPPAPHEAHLDGLFTYCLSVLCDHDAATAVLGEVLAVAERRHGRRPEDPSLRRAWLYALARWSCLRELARRRRARYGTPPRRTAPEPPGAGEETAGQRRGELALLAWPEAAGTTPEQREALELAVRHQLDAPEVAAVLGTTPQAARELLSAAACEVERTRAALAVVGTGACPAVVRLAGGHPAPLSAALRGELVRHVDDCPVCRRAAERAEAAGAWPGSTVTPATLPLVPAPRPAVRAATRHAPRARSAGPRFGRDGFPLDPKDHSARRDRMRARAVTTTVIATVVAAPVLALWAAYRGDAGTGEDRGGQALSVSAGAGARGDDSLYANAGSTRAGARAARPGADVSVEVVGGPAPTPVLSGRLGTGRVAVAARARGDATVLTLTASADGPVDWSLRTDAPWLRVSRTSGTLGPGRSATVYVSLDRAREPRGPWSARIHVAPSGVVVALTGHGADRPPVRPGSAGRPTAPSAPSPSDPPGPPPAPPAASEPPPAAEPPPSSDPPPATDAPPPATTPPASPPPEPAARSR
ncbi:hypothetical protein LUW75_09940 [Streptomyces sp. MRC013]|uniref:BACON domain-containing protein n=1 Tax=Streptomyces sp. MRC013 TaxID=2898276 RepID=UPI00202672C4|nr:hypothetical protein [Streptomyces sp. MRC013]URM90255.1 hypothetical protein LUW75_09940 [Streptomyces sp. MRC013]